MRNKSTDAIADEAAEWVVRLGAANVSPSELRAFVAWLKTSPLHVGEYLRIEQTWADLGRVGSARRVDVNALLAQADANVVELPREAIMAPPVRTSIRTMVFAMAACVLVVAASVALYQWHFANRYATGVGEQRTLRLAEGSSVVLNTSTELRVQFTRQIREVSLLRGEALFNVAKDSGRPFRVRSDHVIAQAIGTSFVVRRLPTQTVITVIEGQVAVADRTRVDGSAPIAIPEAAVLVQAGARADVSSRTIRTTTVANPAAATAWRTGRLIFDGTPLSEVVAEFNRYNTLQIHLDDPQLSSERISGVFHADQPRSLVRFLERSGAITPPDASAHTIVLAPRRQGEQR